MEGADRCWEVIELLGKIIKFDEMLVMLRAAAVCNHAGEMPVAGFVRELVFIH